MDPRPRSSARDTAVSRLVPALREQSPGGETGFNNDFNTKVVNRTNRTRGGLRGRRGWPGLEPREGEGGPGEGSEALGPREGG